jgi:hypothetical protein
MRKIFFYICGFILLVISAISVTLYYDIHDAKVTIAQINQLDKSACELQKHAYSLKGLDTSKLYCDPDSIKQKGEMIGIFTMPGKLIDAEICPKGEDTFFNRLFCYHVDEQEAFIVSVFSYGAYVLLKGRDYSTKASPDHIRLKCGDAYITIDELNRMDATPPKAAKCNTTSAPVKIQHAPQ